MFSRNNAWVKHFDECKDKKASKKLDAQQLSKNLEVQRTSRTR
jgi:hypothetical protein